MSVDFALLLVVLSAVTGLVWLADALFFAKRRRARHGEDAKQPLIVEYARSFFPVIFIVTLGLAATVAWYADNRSWWEPLKRRAGLA